jgi:TonB family protein
MRYVEGLVGLAAVAAVLAALPAEAAPGREPWAKVGEWEVTPYRADSCSADRVYPGGTRISVSSRSSGYAGLSVLNRGWSMQTAGPYRMALVQRGFRQRIAAGANPYLHGLGVSAESGGGLLARLANGGILEIFHPDGRLLQRLELGGFARALVKLRSCLSEAAAAGNFPPVAPPPPPPPPRRGKVRPGGPQAPLPSLFSSADYPPSAIRAGEQGEVGFRVDVGKDGRVALCTVTATSGSAVLDSTTCRLITVRARFTPARDHQGRPTTDSYSGRIIWRLPEPEPPPPPSSP